MGYAGIYKKIKVAVRKPAFYNVLETFYFPEKLHVLNENFLEFSRKKNATGICDVSVEFCEKTFGQFARL